MVARAWRMGATPLSESPWMSWGLIDGLGLQRVNFCGFFIGGLVDMWARSPRAPGSWPPCMGQHLRLPWPGRPSAPQEGYAAGGSAVLRVDLRACLADILLPVLVIVGTRDISTPVAMGEVVVDSVVGAQLAVLESRICQYRASGGVQSIV